jgi:two-component system, NtrC family, C4-dicarboxylate transport response regulator DctD
MTDTVLVVEDDALVREAIGQTLELEGYTPILAGSFIVAKDHIKRDFHGVVLSDIRMPGRDGLYLLDYVQTMDKDLPVILLTGEGDIPMAVAAITKGAFDFLEKPCANDVLIEAIIKAVRARNLVLENRRLKSAMTRGDVASRMIYGGSDKANVLRDQVRKIGVIEGAVLIEGAPGAGIAKVAEVIHLLSARAENPFGRVAGNGLEPHQLGELLNENADGTVFIDEFTALPIETQFALLDHIDRGQGARILAGCSIKLGAQDASLDKLDTDLRIRLEALRVVIPALKERPEDIPVIFREYVQRASEQANIASPEITPEVVAGLMAQEWPGNARALMNAAIRFALGVEQEQKTGELGLVEKLAQVERTLIVDALQKNHGNASATASQLLLPRKTFYDKLTKHGIRPENYR